MRNRGPTVSPCVAISLRPADGAPRSRPAPRSALGPRQISARGPAEPKGRGSRLASRPDWLVTLQGALCRLAAPVVIVSEQIQGCSYRRL
jgi:hypothetical protein